MAVLSLCTVLGAVPARAESSTPAASGSGSATLDAVRARGYLACGVAGTVAGFSLADSTGQMRGIDIDGCRAMAAAIFGDAGKVKFVPVTMQGRFTALQSGEIDILFRGVTWTLSREGSLGLMFGVPYFYDGTAFMVKAEAGVKSVNALNGAAICVQPGTSTEMAISDYFHLHNMTFTPVEISDVQEIQNAFLSDRCDAWSTDSSALAGFRASRGAHADELVLLPEIISKEPLAPIVRKGDDKWFDLTRWVSFAQLTAEEEGVSIHNVEDMLNSPNPDIRHLLGVDGDLGAPLGVDRRWVYAIVKQVGSSADVWERNIAPLGVPRGANNLWNHGGVQYPPPMR